MKRFIYSHVVLSAFLFVVVFVAVYNDVEMLGKCGVGVAVENAVTDAKEVADYICDSCDDDGVAKFIETYLLSEE